MFLIYIWHVSAPISIVSNSLNYFNFFYLQLCYGIAKVTIAAEFPTGRGFFGAPDAQNVS